MTLRIKSQKLFCLNKWKMEQKHLYFNCSILKICLLLQEYYTLTYHENIARIIKKGTLNVFVLLTVIKERSFQNYLYIFLILYINT